MVTVDTSSKVIYGICCGLVDYESFLDRLVLQPTLVVNPLLVFMKTIETILHRFHSNTLSRFRDFEKVMAAMQTDMYMDLYVEKSPTDLVEFARRLTALTTSYTHSRR